ncbi:mannose-6-phosphate isomerase, type 1 [Pisciglobus halotolerans]|uniref:Mannose-6-phosphate isomerase n=1 Tax=Pisciglobus halotolerans TaxID=745365 RepID=A0A1I3C8A4_9LACT|nr:mannose-6-phosphate isomerase, type 1 [Pisciglobus halotolerans]
MLKYPLFLKPVMQEKIWGGTKLEEFGYELPSEHVGECWAISAHPNGPSTVENGPFAGMTLNEVWDKHREVFGNSEGDVFPLLTKILDASQDLSVQVHPDDEYGLEHEGELGKTECWYVIDADEGAEIVYGHHAQSKEELKQMIDSGDWEHLLRKIKVKKGDFFFVPSGTIHAIGGGIMILETQQSSDTTYRVYDYDRKGDDGKPRELHLKQSIEVTNTPHVDPELDIHTDKENNVDITTFVETDFFNVYKWDVSGVATFTADAPYTLVSVLSGEGNLIIDAEHEAWIEKGMHFILPNDLKSWSINGNLEIIASTPGKKLTK